MSLIKLALFGFAKDEKEIRKHEDNQFNAVMEKHQKYHELVSQKAKKLGIRNPRTKAMEGMSIGAITGAIGGGLLGTKANIGPHGAILGGLTGTLLGLNYGNKERKIIHSKYPKLKEQFDNTSKQIENYYNYGSVQGKKKF